jgi:transposase-like protein
MTESRLVPRPPISPVPAAPAAAFDCDVLVVGGGPAGSTIAALLAERGRDVLLVEKAHHPRFHIGESLLPANVALFDRLGVRDQVEAIGMPKWGVEFVSPEHEHRQFVEFADAWDKSMPYAWQVRRSQLDEILFRNAAAKGARTLEGHKVREVSFDADGASAQIEPEQGERRTCRARYLIDASGRDTLLANQLRCKQKSPRHNSSALYGHFTGRRATAGQAAKATSHPLVPARLVLVHPASGRHDEHRRRLLALLPEVAQQARCRISSATRSPCARSWRAGCKMPGWWTNASTPPATTRTRAPAAAASASCSSAMPMPSSTRCFRRACSWRCRTRFRAPTWSRPCSTGAARRRRCGAPSTAASPSDRASSPGSSSASRTRPCASSSWRRRTRSASRRPAVPARRRHLRQNPDLGLDPRPQGALLPVSIANLKRTVQAFKRRRVNIRDVEAAAS